VEKEVRFNTREITSLITSRAHRRDPHGKTRHDTNSGAASSCSFRKGITALPPRARADKPPCALPAPTGVV